MPARLKSNNIKVIAEGIQNEVHLRLELLFREFSKSSGRKIKEKFGEIASEPAIDIIKNIAGHEGIDLSDKIDALNRIYQAAAEIANELQAPELSSDLWASRSMSERNADPFQWVKDKYPSYGRGLHQGHIYNHDRPLYRRLHDAKPWPSDFELPTVAEANDRILDELERVPTLKEIADAAPPQIREMVRLHELARARKRKKAPHKN